MSSSGGLENGMPLSLPAGLDLGLSVAPAVALRGEGLGMVVPSRDLLLTVELAVGAYALPFAGVRVEVFAVALIDLSGLLFGLMVGVCAFARLLSA